MQSKMISDDSQPMPTWRLANLLIFLGFSALALFIGLSGVNQPLFLYINHQHGMLPDRVWEGLNLIAYSRFFILPSTLLLLTITLRRQYIFNVILLIAAYYILFTLLKHVFAVPRPYMVLQAGSFYWLNLFENSVKGAYQSFPSGHCANMAIFAFALNFMFFAQNKFLQFLMLLLVILCGLARICTGWHWPLDVICSGLLGYLLVKLCFILRQPSYCGTK